MNLENLYNESQIKTEDIINKHKSLSTKWKEENRNTFDKFTKIINELKKENKALIHSNIELETQIETTMSEQNQKMINNNNIKRKLVTYEQEIESLTETAENLKSVNENYKKKEALLLNENKSLREELNKTQISMQRLQRTQHFNEKLNRY